MTEDEPTGWSRAVQAVGRRGTRVSPLLRAPPFPSARPRGTPRKARSFRAPLLPAVLASEIAEARVGGSFWGTHPDYEPGFTLVRPRTTQEAREVVNRYRRFRVSPLVLVSFPRRFYLDGSVPDFGPGVRCLVGEPDPWWLIQHAGTIIAAADDEITLLAAAAGQPVLDIVRDEALDQMAALEELAARVGAFDYADPFDGHPVSYDAWIGILADWRRQIAVNRRIVVAVGISEWKRPAIRQILWAGRAAKIKHTVDPSRVPHGKIIATWPSRTPQGLVAAAAAADVPIANIEDGFIRSIGLGVHLNAPRSVVVDLEGIYYDPSAPSALERILNETVFDDALLDRAKALAASIRSHKITKYAVGSLAQAQLPAGRRKILVVGQVEDDLSVLQGGAGIASNLELLKRAREAEPDTYLVYKPHPDVLSGLREGHVSDKDARNHADAVIPDVDIDGLFAQVDAVHVLSSLAGFEALLRGKDVVVHGQPFYSGWGLTIDKAPRLERRRRALTLEQLVAGALILYPRYLDPETNLPCPPEVLVRRHSTAKPVQASILNRVRKAQGQISKAKRALAGAAR